jgi:type IV secretion system protein VirB4
MRIAVFDKDQGMELQVVANHGSYLRLKANQPSGIAPLQLEKNEANIGLNVRLIKKLCTSGGEILTPQESEQIAYAVDQVMSRDRSKRQLRAVYDLMPSDSTTGARARLKKWVYKGENAWLFDNDADAIALDAPIVGFDITDFLELPEVRSPLLMYIAHRVRHEMVRGNPFIWVWDEFWKSLADPEMEYIAKDELKTIRKKGGLLVMGTQEAEDVVNSTIASTIIQATATMILCPNPKADRKAYIDGLKLTEAEFLLVRQGMMPGSNRYLIKQGASSVVVELDLGDPSFANELSILSGTAANIGVYDELVAQLGTKNPDKWLPIFYERRK